MTGVVPYFLITLFRKLTGQDYIDGGVLQPSASRVRQYRENLEVGRRVLDMGTGSGVLAEMAFEKGASEVVAADINPRAVEQATRRVPRAKVVQSDLFDNVQGKFDTIMFAAPWSEGEIRCHAHRALFDNGVTARFLREAKGRLNPGGSVWLEYSDASQGNFSALHRAILAEGYSISASAAHVVWDSLAGRRARVILYRLSPAPRASSAGSRARRAGPGSS